MGYLEGFAVGATDEYLKQRGDDRQEERDIKQEGRANAYQDIRDKRLAEITKSEGKLNRASREKISREKPVTAGAGSNLFQYSDETEQYEKTDSVPNRPTAGTTPKTDETPINRANGQPTTYKQLYNEWNKMKFIINEFGGKVNNPNVPDWETWVNEQVQDQYRINPNKPATVDPNKPPSTASWEAARKEYNEKSSMWESDKSQFGMTEDEWVAKKARENEVASGTAKTGSDNTGMLAEGTAPEAQQAKAPESTATAPIKLSQLAKIDPATMWFELKKATANDDTSEMEIINQIRQHFNDPEWEPPTD